jgi:hypothetical protein
MRGPRPEIRSLVILSEPKNPGSSFVQKYENNSQEMFRFAANAKEGKLHAFHVYFAFIGKDSRHVVWSSAFRRLGWQIVTSSRELAKAGTPNSVHRRTKNHAQRVGKSQHDSIKIFEFIPLSECS